MLVEGMLEVKEKEEKVEGSVEGVTVELEVVDLWEVWDAEWECCEGEEMEEGC